MHIPIRTPVLRELTAYMKNNSCISYKTRDENCEFKYIFKCYLGSWMSLILI